MNKPNLGMMLYYDNYWALRDAIDDPSDMIWLTDAIIMYAQNGTIPETVPSQLKMVFTFLKRKVDESRKVTEDVSEIRSEAGKRGMAKRWGTRSENRDNKDSADNRVNRDNKASADNKNNKNNKDNKNNTIPNHTNPILTNKESSLLQEREDSLNSPLNPPGGNLTNKNNKNAEPPALLDRAAAGGNGGGLMTTEEMRKVQSEAGEVERYWASVIRCREEDLSLPDRDTLCRFIADYGKEKVMQAIMATNAAQQSKHNLQYLGAVLRNNKKAEDAKREELLKPLNKFVMINGSPAEIPDWWIKKKEAERRAALGG